MENIEHLGGVADEPQASNLALADWQVDEAVVVEIRRQPDSENQKTEIQLAGKQCRRVYKPSL